MLQYSPIKLCLLKPIHFPTHSTRSVTSVVHFSLIFPPGINLGLFPASSAFCCYLYYNMHHSVLRPAIFMGLCYLPPKWEDRELPEGRGQDSLIFLSHCCRPPTLIQKQRQEYILIQKHTQICSFHHILL